MGFDTRSEIVIELTPKKLLALSLLMLVGVGAFYSYVIALYAFTAPSQDLSLRFNSVGTFDTGNNTKTTFARGETVRVKVSFEMATSYYTVPPTYYYYYNAGGSYRLIYTVVDSAGEPVHFASVTGMINDGQVKTDFSDYVVLPAGATGVYTIYAYLWTDWLPGGDVLAPNAGTATFTVT